MFENTEFTEEQIATFCEVLTGLVTKCGGMFEGRLFAVALDNGEKREIHVQAHDAVWCEMQRLEGLDMHVGGGTLQ